MLAWYGHAEPDVVAAFEAEHNVKFKPKYYTGGDNMLGLISQSPPGTFDVILSRCRIRPAAQRRRLYRGARSRRLPFRRVLSRVPAVSRSLAGRQALLGADPLRLPRRRLQYRRADWSRRPRRTTSIGRLSSPARSATSTGTCRTSARSASCRATPRPTTSTRTPGMRCKRRR